MTRDEAIRRLREITKGIDADECESDDGWWDTSSGAEFGAGKLAEIEALIAKLTA